MIRHLIAWGARRARREGLSTWVVDEFDRKAIKRFCFFLPDEFTGRKGFKYNTLPWWCPFNMFLHCWRTGTDSSMHDHPRWSVTICLRGRILEQTPWSERLLKPFDVVFRSHKAIHAFSVDSMYGGRTWTLFIVGRREHEQHWYRIRTFD